MNNAQGGYRIIDFNGIDLINKETPNTYIYKSIEESYKSKAFLLSNIVIDKVEYNAVFKEIKHIDNYFTFEVYDRIIKVYADKVESLPKIEIKTIDYNNLEKSMYLTGKEINISSQQSSRITITNIEPKGELYLKLGYDKSGIYSYLISQPFKAPIHANKQHAYEITIDTYDSAINTDNPYTSIQLVFVNRETTTLNIIIDITKVNNIFVINFVNATRL